MTIILAFQEATVEGLQVKGKLDNTVRIHKNPQKLQFHFKWVTCLPWGQLFNFTDKKVSQFVFL